MSLCPKCGLVYCDHPEDERGQTYQQMMRDFCAEERAVWTGAPAGQIPEVQLQVAQAHVGCDTPCSEFKLTLPLEKG
jgi:hypothetical protein